MKHCHITWATSQRKVTIQQAAAGPSQSQKQDGRPKSEAGFTWRRV